MGRAGGMCLFDDALTSGSAIVSKTHSPCSQSCDFWEKIRRYYGTKIVRSNIRKSNAAQHSYVRRESVILNLFQDLRIPPTLTLPLKGGREKLVSEAHIKHLVPYCLSNLVSSKKSAFTLAEVLITLGIIGVVAAMTIPTLVANYQEKQTVSKLIKAYAAITNAYTMAKAENGDLNTWGFAGSAGFVPDEDGNNTYNDAAFKNAGTFWNMLRPYLKSSKLILGNGDDQGEIAGYEAYMLNGTKSGGKQVALLDVADGTTYTGGWINNPNCRNKTVCGDIAIDINGWKTPPNTFGKDKFFFSIYRDAIIPMGLADATERTFEDACDRDGNTSGNGYGCTAWVIYNKNMDYLHCDDLSWDGKHKCSN